MNNANERLCQLGFYAQRRVLTDEEYTEMCVLVQKRRRFLKEAEREDAEREWAKLKERAMRDPVIVAGLEKAADRVATGTGDPEPVDI